MKKIISLLILLTLAVSITGCSVRFGIKDNENYSSEIVNLNESIQLNNEDELIIDIKIGKVTIVGYDGDEVIVSGKSNRGSNIIKLSKDENEIEVIDISENQFNIGLFGDNIGDKTDIEIKVPNKFNGDIDFSYGAGEAIIKNLTCNKLDIEGGAGELNINDIIFNNLDFSAGVGESNINLSNKCGDIKIEGGVGEVEVVLSEVGGNLDYEGGIGSARIQIPENAPVYFDTSSGIGSSNVNAKTSGENIYKFTLEVGVGDIKVYN